MSKRDEYIQHLSQQDHITENHLQQFREKISGEDFEKSLDTPYDLKLFNCAEEYRKSAQYLIKKPENYHQAIYMEHVRAYVLCLSFSLELYVKCLLIIKNKNSHGHEITKLFKKLNGKTRAELSHLYGIRTTNKSLNEEEFILVLSKVNNIFVEWRYVYENDYSGFIDIQTIWHTINCFREHILRIKNNDKLTT